MRAGYAETIHQLLAVYRFLAYGLAVILIQVIPLSQGVTLDLEALVILVLVGVYTFLKVFSPLRWREAGVATYVVLGGDVLLVVLLLLVTAGLDSGYLLYSLLPVTTAALLFPEATARTVAAVTVAAPILAHTVLSQFMERHAWLLEGVHLPQLLLFVAFCFLVATLTYYTNVNIRRRIVLVAVQDERFRTRRELHDGVAQSLGFLRMRTRELSKSLDDQNLEKARLGLEELQTVVQSTYEDIREAIDQFSSDVAGRPLLPALKEYLQEFSQRNAVPVDFQAPESMDDLSPQAELQLYRIAQEAMTNVRKHTQATQVWVTLEATPQEVSLEVRDNGQGMAASDGQPAEGGGGHGLTVMRERAEELGGTVVIKITPGEGTELKVVLPREKVRH